MKLGKYTEIIVNKDGSFNAITSKGNVVNLTKEEYYKQQRAVILGVKQRECRTYRFVVNEEIKTLEEWAIVYNIDPLLVHNRLFKLGWHIEAALSTPPQKRRNAVPLLVNKNENILPKRGRGRPKGSKKEVNHLILDEIVIDLDLYNKWLSSPMVFRKAEYGYCAYSPSNLVTPVVNYIMPSFEGFYWNCYKGAEGEFRKQVAAKVLSIINYNT